jgi:hypothetical protein
MMCAGNALPVSAFRLLVRPTQARLEAARAAAELKTTAQDLNACRRATFHAPGGGKIDEEKYCRPCMPAATHRIGRCR